MRDGLTHLRVEEQRGYWIVVLDCARGSAPGAPNVLSLAVLADLQALVEEVERRRDVAAVILTGTEAGGFAAGADLRELHRLAPQEAFAFSRRGQLLFRRLERARPLFIAAIDGYCIGGGLDLALACDLRYATTRSVFAHPGARLGVLTGWGGTARLPRVLGRVEALRLFLTAEPISAAEALHLGLIHQMTDGDVLALARRWAEAAVRLGPHAVSHVRGVLGAATEYR